MRPSIFFYLAILAFIPATVYAEKVYEWIDKDGRIHYSNQPETSSGKQDSTTHDWTDPRGHKIYSDRSRDQLKAEKQRRRHNLECMSGLIEIIDNPKIARREQVVLLTASWCSTSRQARQYLKRNNISFVEYDVDRNPKGHALYLSLEQRGVPVLLAGRQHMFGFSEELAEQVLNRSGHPVPGNR